MKLLDLYKHLSLNTNFFERYYSTSSKNYGKVFSFISTNYRGILIKSGTELQGFAQGFRVIKSVEGIKRSNWPRRAKTQQEVEKQHVVNMRKSEFFRVIDDAYQITSRGIVFEKLLNDTDLSHEEKKFICLLLILAGYFSDIPNYIVEQTIAFFSCCERAGYAAEEVLTLQENFVSKANTLVPMSDLVSEDYLFLDSFYRDLDGIDFLKAFKEASFNEKEELKRYISKNLKLKNNKTKNNGCVISYKYRSGGNYVKNTILDNAWILFVTKHIVDSTCNTFDTFINTAIDAYKKLFRINDNHLRRFIYDTNKNRSVFQVIFCKITGTPLSPLVVEKDLTEKELQELSLSDSTDMEGAAYLNIVSVSLKKLAKLNAGYHCALESCEMCRYFTSKETGKNYLEIHHFIPREFQNDFDEPIEIIDNYVALCPHCHRKIHLAVDLERKYMINTIFTQRKDLLAAHGLQVQLTDLYRYYKIEI